jgi:hypothetical protein
VGGFVLCDVEAGATSSFAHENKPTTIKIKGIVRLL